MVNSNSVLTHVWQLRTHPFAPSGISARKLRRPLDPLDNEGLLPYYFDLYEWEKSGWLEPLFTNSNLKSFNFGNLLDSEEAYLLFITGDGDYGRKSLKNLVFYLLTKFCEGDEAPIFIDADLGSELKMNALMSLASFLIDDFDRKVPTAKRDRLDAILNRELGRGANPNTIINLVGAEIRDQCGERPIVLHIVGAEHSDTWRLIHSAVRKLAALLVLTTSNKVQANGCLRSFQRSERKLVSLVHAARLEREKARKFLRTRIEMHRVEDADLVGLPVTAPFTDDAIDGLYEPGDDDTKDTEEQIRRSFVWLIETFRYAIDKNRTALDTLLSAGDINPADHLITREQTFNYRQEMNKVNTGRT